MFSDTVVSCFPQRWDTWSTDFRIRPPPPPPANLPGGQPPPRQTVPPEPGKLSQLPSDGIHAPPQFPLSEEAHDETNILIKLNESKSKVKDKNDPPSILTWMAGKKKKSRKDSIDAGLPLEETRDSRPTSSIEREEKKKRRAFLQLDPLNVQQTILKHLQGTTRAPLTSAYDLANLVTNSCADVFDQFKTPPEFQFFDFFERSIGALVS
jgi:hypothetical protein